MTSIFRADGSQTIGLGHIMRCLCLAEAWREDGHAIYFVTKKYESGILELIRRQGFELEVLEAASSLEADLRLLEKIRLQRKVDCIVIDAYHVDEHYLWSVKQTGVKLISIDDKAELHFPSDLVINPNLGFDSADYKNLEASRLLLGPRYALLRPEFKHAHRQIRQFIHPPKNILLTLGGGNAGNLLNGITEWLGHLPFDFKVQVVLGAASRDRLLRNTSSGRFEIKINVSNMADLMTDADLAIIAAGTTCWEAACTGLPALLIELADNQSRNAEQLHRRGIAIHCGKSGMLTENSFIENFKRLYSDTAKRQEMSAQGKALVDGEGTKRIIAKLKRIIDEKN